MRIPWLVAQVFSIACLLVGAGGVHPQNFPSKPIRIVAPEAGGGGDFASRIIAQALSANLGQPVVVDNRPSGIIPGEIVARAQPDGYTLLINGASHWLLPFFQDNLSWDPVKDFAPISLITRGANILVVYPGLPAKSTKDLIALAKAKPGELNYGTSGNGSSGHLSVELFKSMTGVQMTRVRYKGNGPSLNGVAAGEVQLTFASASGVTPHLKAGRLRALAVTTAQPSALYPELPTIGATVPGYESSTTSGVFAPIKTSKATVDRLNQEIVRVLRTADVKDKFSNIGVEPVGTTPDELAATIKSEMSRLGKVIKDAGLKSE